MPTYNVPNNDDQLYCCHHQDKKGAMLPMYDEKGNKTFYRMDNKKPEKGYQWMCKECNSLHMTEYRKKALKLAEKKAIMLSEERRASKDQFFDASTRAIQKISASELSTIEKEELNGHIRLMTALYMQV